ncbi:LacI family DNA-binding transcriptional regulator [Pelagicoccus sp. SDUM812002]|uniref:LacI family DNA-binding transcriptional regulator n=1 Tax=Pelagicoccus sp. SDUM812002 TaxID=3041266 RepID=UPI00280C446F|nr:LacI family DNA-binding transcriptional regulator [Pelagicoccus sp. SDUM812002]MDQ8185538.1 LacI family DNA-binding transcriptional regulator [Pelagicoccus sp. SDUM812002]
MPAPNEEENNIRSVGDFAKYLGLSRWTVSRILNGHSGVHEDTRERVMSEMHRLGFQPNMMARSLKGAKTGLIGVCFQEIESPILARKISSLQESLRSRGLRAVMEITSGLPEAERDIINHFLSLRVDGVILIGSGLAQDDPILARLVRESVPVVTVDSLKDIPLPSVDVDRHAAMGLTLRHLQQRGHESFALLGLESDPIYGSRRIDGLKEAAQRLRLDWDKSFLSIKIDDRRDWSYEYGYDLAQSLLQLESPPRGVIALNDRVAIGAMKAIREWGYEIPTDFSVVGFDNLEIGQWCEPTLTTVGQNVAELIEKSVGLIEKLIGGQEKHEVGPAIMVQPKLIVRASS